MKHEFLEAVLGTKGSQKLERVSSEHPMLESVIVPRTILSWVETVGKLGYEGRIPGQDGSYLSLAKNENNGFCGALTIGDDLYTFEDVDSLHVSASIGVALGLNIPPLDDGLKKRDLSQLGKSIDLLVKSTIVKAHKDHDLRSIKITRAESARGCQDCGAPYFQNGNVSMCFCTRDLAKSIKTELIADGYKLTFDKSLDDDAVATVTTAFKLK
jgi:hypothetical protein